MLPVLNKIFFGVDSQEITNRFLHVEYLTGAGPRIVGLYRSGVKQNFLAETPSIHWETPNGTYHLRGGHRLWSAPERFPLSSLPDDQPVTISRVDHGVCITQKPEEPTGIKKSIELLLDDDHPTMQVTHTLTNCGDTSQKVAPWGITLMPLGGVAVLPQHTQILDDAGLLPNRHLVLWPYTRITDRRLRFGETCWTVQADADPGVCKIGYLNLSGWVAYLYQGLIFCKWFSVDHTLDLADMGCNVEVYANQHVLELETLGHLALLQPGESVVLTERWGCFDSIEDPFLDDNIRKVIQNLPG